MAQGYIPLRNSALRSLGVRPCREQVSQRRGAQDDAVIEIGLPAKPGDPLRLQPEPAKFLGQFLFRVEFLGHSSGLVGRRPPSRCSRWSRVIASPARRSRRPASLATA